MTAITRKIIFVLCALLFCMCAVGDEQHITLSQSEKDFLMRSARETMLAALKDTETVPRAMTSTEALGESSRTAYVTLFCEGQVIDSRVAVQDSYSKAVAVAAARVGAALRARPNGESLIQGGRIKIDLIGELVPVQVSGYFSVVDVLDVGVEGAAVKVGDAARHMLPTTILFNSRTADSMLQKILSISRRTSPDGKAHLMKFRTVTLMEEIPEGRVLDLYRGNVLVDEIDSSTIEQSFRAAGYWLLGVQGSSGRFKYRFNPVDRIQDVAYSVVRQAGACWSLLWLYQRTGDEKFLHGADKGLQYLQRYVRTTNVPQLYYLEAAKRGSLAASSLYMICLADLAFLGGQMPDEETLQGLAHFILQLQMDSGGFYGFLEDAQAKAPPDRLAHSPGRAIVALLRGYRLRTAEGTWLTAAQKAAEFEINRFDSGHPADHWTMLALAELYGVTREPRHAEACLKMADSILPQQLLPGKVPDEDFVGGFNDAMPPLTVSAATRMQGLAAAWDLAGALGKERVKYADAVLLAAKFIMQQQFRSDNAYMADPTFTWAGGFHASPTDFELRLDCTQNCICALICASDISRAGE